MSKEEKKLREQEEAILSIKSLLEKFNQDLEACGLVTNQPSSSQWVRAGQYGDDTQSQFQLCGTKKTFEPSFLQLSVGEPATSLNSDPVQQSLGRPQPPNRLSSRRSLGLRLLTEPTFIQEAAAVVPAPTQQHNLTGAADTQVSHHASVLADRSVRLPNSALASLSLEQTPVAPNPMLQPLSVQQPVSFEPVNWSLHRPACFSALNTDVLCHEAPLKPSSSEDSWPQEHNIPHQ